jgi:protease-4
VFKSGKFKDMLSGEKTEAEALPEERQMLQAMIDETFARFKTVVSNGRRSAGEKNGGEGRELRAAWEEIADGRILSGRQAYDAGLVDELGNFETAVDRAKALAGIASANVVRYIQPFDLGNLFRLFGDSEARTVKLDLGLQVPQLRVGRLYFLAPTVVP